MAPEINHRLSQMTEIAYVSDVLWVTFWSVRVPDRCRGKFVAPRKFFPPPYCHNVTNANLNPNPNLNLSPNPNLNLNPNPYCSVWEEFSGAKNFPLHRRGTM